MKISVICTFVLLFLLHSCVVDPSKDKAEPKAEESGVIDIIGTGKKVIIHDQSKEELDEIKKKFPQPEIKQVTVEVDIPLKEDWYLVQEKNIEGFTPLGITCFLPDVFITDTTQQLVMRVNMATGAGDVLLRDSKVTYINQRVSRLLLPMFDYDSIFVYRGGSVKEDLYKIQIPYELKNPTRFEGLRIDNFTVVDQGNHRVVRNKNGEFSLIGSYGADKEQFDSPSSIVWSSNNIYITDTGNSRVQVINEDGRFINSFGKNDGMIRPTGIDTDGKHIFVCDEGLKAILVYMPNGKLAYKLDHLTKAPSDLYYVDGRLYVADKEGSTIKVLGNKVYQS